MRARLAGLEHARKPRRTAANRRARPLQKRPLHSPSPYRPRRRLPRRSRRLASLRHNPRLAAKPATRLANSVWNAYLPSIDPDAGFRGLRTFSLVTRSLTKPHIPSKDELIAFISRQSGKVGTRELARAFGLKNADRAALKHMLRELADEGRVEHR